jgi:hypothetical protein
VPLGEKRAIQGTPIEQWGRRPVSRLPPVSLLWKCALQAAPEDACHAATTPIKTDPTPSQGVLITSQQSIKIYKQRTKQFFHFRFTPFLSTFQEICSKGKIDFSCNRNITIFVKNITTKNITIWL